MYIYVCVWPSNNNDNNLIHWSGDPGDLVLIVAETSIRSLEEESNTSILSNDDLAAMIRLGNVILSIRLGNVILHKASD
jgi:hypothetical protein